MAQRQRRLLIWLGGLGVLLVACGGGGGGEETEQRPALRLESHPFRQWVLAPDQIYTEGEVSFAINKLGFRGPVPEEKAPTAFRILTLGDGSVVDPHQGPGESWPERLGTVLKEAGFSNVEAFNAGVPGYSSRHTLSLYLDRIRALEPDLLVVYQGWEDLKAIILQQQGKAIEEVWRVPAEGIRWSPDSVAFSALQAEALAEPQAASPLENPPMEWQSFGAFEAWKGQVETLVWRSIKDGAIPVLVVQNTLVTHDVPPPTRASIQALLADVPYEDILLLQDLMATALDDIARRFHVPLIDLRSALTPDASSFASPIELQAPASRKFGVDLAAQLIPILESSGQERSVEPGALIYPVARWPFEGDDSRVVDLGPFGLEGRLKGGVVRTASGVRGEALEFDGKSGQIVFPLDRALDLEHNFRIGVWVNLMEREATGSQGLVVKAGAYHLAIRGGRPAFYGYGLEPQIWHSGENPIPTEGWHLITAGFLDGAVTLSMDGVPQYRLPVQGSIRQSVRPLLVGNGNGFFRGRLDEVWLSVELEAD
jgi:hypothetical protein